MNSRPDPDKCIACTTCVTHCPVATATPKYPGPRMIGPAYERFRPLGLPEDSSLQYCSNCKNCEISCPHGVPVAAINMLARAKQFAHSTPSFRDWIVAHGETLAQWLRFVPASLKNFGMNNILSRTALDWLGIAKDSPLPRFAPQTFRKRLRQFKQPACEKQIVFFPGCYIDIYDPDTGLALVELLNRAGYQVIAPDTLLCCGLPLISNGFWQEAEQHARINMSELAQWSNKNIPIISACPSCTLMFASDLPEFFPNLTQQYGQISVEDAQSFLLHLVDNGQITWPNLAQENKLKIIYHAPCHLRARGQGLPGMELLARLPNVSVVNANAGCCGISGSYGFKKEKFAISQQIGANLFQVVRESGADVAASECGVCRVQINFGSGKTCLHPVKIVHSILQKNSE